MAALCCPTISIVSGKLSPRIKTLKQFPRLNSFKNHKRLITKGRSLIVGSIIEDREAIDVKSESLEPKEEEEDKDSGWLMSRGINAAIVLAAGTVAVTKLLSIDHDYWHGWTLYEILSVMKENLYLSLIEVVYLDQVLLDSHSMVHSLIITTNSVRLCFLIMNGG